MTAQHLPSRFARDTRANFAMTTVIGLSVLLMGAGAALDFAGSASRQAGLQEAVDSAILSLAVNGEDDEEKRLAFVRGVIEAQFDGEVADVRIEEPGGEITVSATSTYTPLLMSLFGFDTMDVGVSATVPLGGGGVPLDVVLVLDVTDSMNWAATNLPGQEITTMDQLGREPGAQGSKLAAMKSAATSLIDDLEAAGDGNVSISVVPFSDYVRIPDADRNASWLEPNADGTEVDDESCQIQELTNPDACTEVMRPQYRDGRLIGERMQNYCPSEAYTRFATPVCTPQPRTLQWYGCAGYRDGALSERPEFGGNRIPRVYLTNCASAYTPLTSNMGTVRDAVDELTGSRATYMPGGIVWGWRMLDGSAPYPNPRADTTSTRALVLMSDGENSLFRCESGAYLNNDNLTAHMDILCEDADWGDVEDRKEDTITRTRRLCDAIKQDGIRIYTIAYMVTGAGAADAQNLIRGCASEPGDYFNVGTESALFSAFDDIGSSLVQTEVRLKR